MTTVSDNLIHHSDSPAGYLAEGGGVRASIRDRIKAIAPYSKDTVHVEEWDTDIELRSLSLGERNDMLNKSRGEDGQADADISVIYPEMLIRTCFDPETGEKVFAEDDAAFINSLPASIMDKLAIPSMKLSGMADTAKEDAAKKSPETEVSD